MVVFAGGALPPIPTTYLEHCYEEFQGLEEGLVEDTVLSPPCPPSWQQEQAWNPCKPGQSSYIPGVA